jgi:SAM-dependent methyltransferase
MAFKANSFDLAICGFMGWDDCFDFNQNQFTQTDKKGKEIWRVLKDGGRFVCCTWEEQEDLRWMEEAMIRHFPAILRDRDYLEQRPIGMSYENIEGYEIIFRGAGFGDIRVSREELAFISTDEDEWWRQMQQVGWDSLLEKIEHNREFKVQRIKDAIFKDLQEYKQTDGIHFTKKVFFVSGIK